MFILERNGMFIVPLEDLFLWVIGDINNCNNDKIVYRNKILNTQPETVVIQGNKNVQTESTGFTIQTSN